MKNNFPRNQKFLVLRLVLGSLGLHRVPTLRFQRKGNFGGHLLEWMAHFGQNVAVAEIETFQVLSLATGARKLADGEELSVGHVELYRHPERKHVTKQKLRHEMAAAVANPPVRDDVHVQLLGPLLAAHGAGLQVGGLDDLGAVGGADHAGALLRLPEGHLQPALDDVLLRGGQVAQRRGRARLHGDQVQCLGDRDVYDT